jgi:integrase
MIAMKNPDKGTMVLSDYLYNLLKRRHTSATNQYVFPSESKAGYLNDPRKAVLKVRELSGVEFIVHDLRRTFITIAESLDIPVYALKRLLNHKMKSDVTAGYVVMDIERLRKLMQMITDHVLRLIGLKELGNVVDFPESTSLAKNK